MSIKLAATKTIMDPVHGAIAVLDHEAAIIDHAMFQRLRHITQNDVLFLVFPGATHTRFAHSIGVMHVADRIFRTLIDAHMHRRNTAGAGELGTRVVSALGYLRQVVRLAGLLHDAGHGAFSHQSEASPSVRRILDRQGTFESLWSGVERAHLYGTNPRRISHEHYSVRVAHALLGEPDVVRAGIERDDVLSVMETTEMAPSEAFCAASVRAWEAFAGRGNRPPQEPRAAGEMMLGLLRAIISGEVDADKCDYLLRDAYHTGASYGNYNLDTLLGNLRCGYSPDEGWLGLAINHKGLPAFEDFVYSRYQMYRHVYTHKTAIGFEILLLRAINEVMEDADTAEQIERMLTDAGMFTYLTDNFFWERFRGEAINNPQSACARVLGRDKLKFLASFDDLDETELEFRRRSLAQDLGVAEHTIVRRDSFARFSSVGDDYQAIRVVRRNLAGGGESLVSVASQSEFFTKFSDSRRAAFFYDRPRSPGSVRRTVPHT